MEHAYASGSTVETPWRTAAMVAAGVAAVELFILIVVAVFLGAKLVTDHAEKATSPAAMRAVVEAATKPAATTPATKGAPVANLPRSRTSIIVMNGNGTPGAASIVADRLSHFHYIVAATGNAPRSDFRRSVVMYRTAAFKGEALRLAKDLHLRRVAPLDGMTRRDLQGAHLALIIGG